MVCLWRGATRVLDAINLVRFPVEVITCRYSTAPYAIFEASQNPCNSYASTHWRIPSRKYKISGNTGNQEIPFAK